MEIALFDIADPPIFLRSVDQQSVEFRELCDSMRDFGQHNSILVRPHNDRPYQLVDGAYRLAAARKLGWTTIEATIREVADSELLAIQIQANAVGGRETTRMEYAKHLLRIQKACPETTMVELAKYSGKNTYWVRQQLDLLNLRLEYQTMADRGIIPVMNAYALAKLPPHIQGRYIEQAQVMPPPEFKQLIAAEIQRLTMNAKDRAEERRIAALTSEPHPFLRPLKDLTGELRSQTAAKGLIAAVKPKTPIDAFTLGVAWALNVDPLTAEDRKARLADKKISRVIERNLED